MLRLCIAGLLCPLFCTIFPNCASAAETRVALVIGESSYQYVERLPNPARDAEAIDAALRQAGFTTVMVKIDINNNDLREALKSFSSQAARADVAAIYYAGHGIELGGENYLIPIDARLNHDTDVQYEAVPLDMAVSAVSEASRLGIVMLDACRNNPFANTMQYTRGATYRSVTRGLGAIEPSRNTLVVYAARAGTTAIDGEGNSPFALALKRRLPTPGLEIGLLFRQVHDDVMASTNQQQEPFVYGALSGAAYYFVPGPAPDVKLLPAPNPRELELAFWRSIENSTNAADFQAYLDRYPQGEFAQLARNRIAALRGPVNVPDQASVSQQASYSEPEVWDEWVTSIQFASRSRTIIDFLAKYPIGPHVAPARKRIQELQAQGK